MAGQAGVLGGVVGELNGKSKDKAAIFYIPGRRSSVMLPSGLFSFNLTCKARSEEKCG